MAGSPHHGLVDIARTLRGTKFVLDALLPDIAGLDLRTRLPRLDVPIVLCQGRLDRIQDPATAEEYFAMLEAASGKELVWFGDSAHMPQVEEPAKFAEVVRRAAARAASRSLEGA